MTKFSMVSARLDLELMTSQQRMREVSRRPLGCGRGRKGRREGGREGGRQAGREGGRQAGREGGREGGRELEEEGRRQRERMDRPTAS